MEVREDIVKWCVLSVYNFLNFGTNTVAPPESLKDAIDDDMHVPVFVTFINSKDDTLRGCIGTTSPISINLLPIMGLKAAIRDPRFRPMSTDDLLNCSCKVSFLINFEECSLFDWEIGQHGIQISFSDKGKQKTAIFLPEVMIDHKFSKEQTILELIHKAGGNPSSLPLREIKAQRFQSSILSLDCRPIIEEIGCA